MKASQTLPKSSLALHPQTHLHVCISVVFGSYESATFLCQFAHQDILCIFCVVERVQHLRMFVCVYISNQLGAFWKGLSLVLYRPNLQAS